MPAAIGLVGLTPHTAAAADGESMPARLFSGSMASTSLIATMAATLVVLIALWFLRARLRSTFDNLLFATKFPLVVVGAALLAALATGYTAYSKFTMELEDFAKGKIEALRDSRQATLESYLHSIRHDLALLASSDRTRDAVLAFSAAFTSAGGRDRRSTPKDVLQRLYIRDNPHPVGRKDELIDAGDGSDYSEIHRKYHEWFREFQRQHDYYDVFLFSIDGDLVYTVFKEPDFATNVIDGDWKDTDLGRAFRAVDDNPIPTLQVYFDFKPYEPSFGAPAAFIAMPVFNLSGLYIGVIAFQMPIGRINELMQLTAGLGRTGETYLVGDDLLMRSDSRFGEESTLLKTAVATPTAKAALAGGSGVAEVDGYRGERVVSAYAPIDFMGAHWALLAEVDVEEIFAPVHRTAIFMVMTTGLIMAVVAFIGVALARGLSRPIVDMTEAMRQLAGGNLDLEVGHTARGDEIGEMADALDVFRENAIQRRLAEQELRQSREALAEKTNMLETVFRSMNEGIVAFDKDLKLLAWNDHFIEIRNFPAEFAVEGRPFEDFVRYDVERYEYGPTDREKVVERVVERARRSKQHAFERQRPDGRWIEVRGGPIAGGGFVSTFADITEKKTAELERERQRALLDQVLANIAQGVVKFDGDKRIAIWNERFRTMLRLPEDIMQSGRPAEDFSLLMAKRGDYGEGDPDDIVAARRQQVWAREAGRRELRFGDSVYDVLSQPTDDGGVVVTYTDITERERAAEALAMKEAQLRVAMDNMPGGMAMYDEDLHVVIANERVHQYLEYPAELMQPGGSVTRAFRHMAERGDYGSGNADELVAARVEAYRSRRQSVREARTPSGRIVDIRLSPVEDGSTVVVIDDVTQRRRAEEELRRAYSIIRESVGYASNIQRSLLPAPDGLDAAFADYFVLWEPRDVVGGDFYWFRPCEDGHVLIVCDCTGHGVPGAFMTLIGTGALNQALVDHPDGDPAKLLEHMNRTVQRLLLQDRDDGHADDGMELGICRIETSGRRLTFAGARFALLVAAPNGELNEIRGDKTGIGYRRVDPAFSFANHGVEVAADMTFYLYSDGIVDQIGGEKRRAFGRKRLTHLLAELRSEPLSKHDALLSEALLDYQGDEVRRDDVTVVGFRCRQA